MTQEESWQHNYNEVMWFVKTNRRNLSKYDLEERQLYTWVKHNRKVMNAGKMRPERVEAFGRLMALMEEYKRKNQYM